MAGKKMRSVKMTATKTKMPRKTGAKKASKKSSGLRSRTPKTKY